MQWVVGKINPATQEIVYTSDFDNINGLDQQQAIMDERIERKKTTTSNESTKNGETEENGNNTCNNSKENAIVTDRLNLPLQQRGKGSNQKEPHCEQNVIRFAVYLQRKQYF
jgi:hypothetical protein